jgi:hypothetical protein
MTSGVIKVLGAALLLTVMAASAQAQMGGSPGGGRHAASNHQKSNEPAKPKADDKAYSSALKGLPDKPYDPWHGIH